MCTAVPCIDPQFAPIGGPTASAFYWSAQEFACYTSDSCAMTAEFSNGTVSQNDDATDSSVALVVKLNAYGVRAVRAGSCTE